MSFLSLKTKFGVLADAAKVRRVYGKGVFSQFRDMVKLYRGPGRVGATEYYYYGLYDDGRFSPMAKDEFVGWRMEGTLDELLNKKKWIVAADDKLVLYAILKGLGLPFPSLYAIYHPGGRSFGSVPCFKDAGSMADFVRGKIPYPFFSKPVHGGWGLGAVAVESLDRGTGKLRFGNGQEIGLEEFIGGLLSRRGEGLGHLFQECLAPHPVIGEVCGTRLSGVRMIVLMSRDGPHLFRAIWKVPTGRNMTDNFVQGTSGNLLGSVNVETGHVERVVRGVGLGLSEVSVHPDTGKSLVGLALPNWREMVEVCLTAASALPGLRFQHWDIALCPRGPVILELNTEGSLDLPQLAGRAGVYDRQMRECLAETALID